MRPASFEEEFREGRDDGRGWRPDEVAVDTGVTGWQQPALNESTEATAKVDPAAGPGGRKWKVAFDNFENTSMAAIRLRCIANEQGKQEN